MRALSGFQDGLHMFDGGVKKKRKGRKSSVFLFSNESKREKGLGSTVWVLVGGLLCGHLTNFCIVAHGVLGMGVQNTDSGYLVEWISAQQSKTSLMYKHSFSPSYQWLLSALDNVENSSLSLSSLSVSCQPISTAYRVFE